MTEDHSRAVSVQSWKTDGRYTYDDKVAAETPLALTYNKRSHVVMMVTPDALEDFAIGFSLTEGIIQRLSDVLDVSIIGRDKGLELAIRVDEECFSRLETQRRNLVGRTGCGLCGAESLEQAVHRPSSVAANVSLGHRALETAITSLDAHQPMQASTGAVHGAAWCDTSGRILAVREDVGRHNALDKLIGHLVSTGYDPGAGFALVSSRASYEMVYKAAAAGIEVLVAVSAPTTLAIDYAGQCGITLVGFARPGRHNIYTFEGRIRAE